MIRVFPKIQGGVKRCKRHSSFVVVTATECRDIIRQSSFAPKCIKSTHFDMLSDELSGYNYIELLTYSQLSDGSTHKKCNPYSN